jgi:hypothetical protein
MRRLLAAGMAAMAVALGQGLEAGKNCSCGLLGSACDVTGWVNLDEVVTPTPVTNFPGGLCSEQGLCVVVGSDAKCACDSGYKGKLCEEMADVLELHLGIALALGLALLVGCAVLQLLHDRRTEYRDYAFAPSATTEGFASKRVLLAYRVLMALLGVGVILQMLVANKRPDYLFRAYTVWNWTLLTCFFILGSYLSVRACSSDYHSGGRTETNLAERVFYVLMQVELPNTVLIALVVWLLLLPAAAQNGMTEVVVNPNSFIVHAANVGIMLVEFALNGLRFNKRQ